MPAEPIFCPKCQTAVTTEICCQACQHVFALSATVPAATLALPGDRPDAPKATLPENGKPAATWMEDNAPAATLPNGSGMQPAETLSEAVQVERGEHGVPASVGPECVGRFEIVRPLGEGAFGKVYLAHDPLLDRSVALKVAKLGSGDVEERVERFKREAKTAASLYHPHIVPVHEYGQDGDRFYIASAFIDGQSLADLLEGQDQGQPKLPVEKAVQIIRQLAEALAYAHGEGTVHRDVKPDNVMIDEKKEPVLMDFGLATRAEEAARRTHAGAILGTPMYMSPEQAAGKGHEATPASDQYSLGVMLYEMLTGRVPFEGAADVIMFHHVRTEPPTPRKYLPGLSRDLETICLKCLEKEPARRYADCAELAEDLRRVQAGEPTIARPVGRAERLAKWCRRNPAVASLLAMVVLVMLAGSTISTLFGLDATAQSKKANKLANDLGKSLLEVQAQKRKADDETDRKDKALTKTEWLLYAANITLARIEWERNNVALALHYLDQCRSDFRSWEERYLRHLYTEYRQQTLRGHSGKVTSVTFSPDGKRLASASEDETAKIWDAMTGQEFATLRGHSGRVFSVAFSPDSKRLATAGLDDGTVKIWDATTGQEIVTLRGHSGKVTSVTFSPDGKRLASASSDGTAKVWEAGTGHEMLTLRGGHNSGALSVAFSPDGKRLATAGMNTMVRLWDANTGYLTLTLLGHNQPVNSVTFSPDGKRLATASDDGTARVWDANTGQQTNTLFEGGFISVTFSPDGKRLAGAGSSLKVWDAVTAQESFALRGHTGWVNSVAFSPDGKRLASGSTDGTVKVWDAVIGQENLTLRGYALSSVTFNPDSKRLSAASSNGQVKIWDAATRKEVLTLTLRGHNFRIVRLSPDGKRVASASKDKTVTIWDAASGQEALVLRGHTSRVYSVVFSADGKRLANASEDGTLKIWDAVTGREILILRDHRSRINTMTFSPDKKRLATVGTDNAIKIWDAATGQATVTLRGHLLTVASLAFSPDGQRLATASTDNTVKVWDAGTGQEILTLHGHIAGVNSVTFSPDGKRLASAGWDKTVKVWDAMTGQETITLRERKEIMHVIFSPDGNSLAGVSLGGIKIWDAGMPQEKLSLALPAAQVPQPQGHSGPSALVPGKIIDVQRKLAQASETHIAKLMPGKVYVISLSSKSFDGSLLIQNSKGEIVAQGDRVVTHPELGRNKRHIVLEPNKEEHYRIIVTSDRGEGRGAYDLTVVDSGAAAAPVPFIGNSVKGRLTESDPPDKVHWKSPSKLYTCMMEAGTLYTINVESDDFDPFLRLEDPNGKQLRVRPLDGLNVFRLDSRISFAPTSSGKYRIVVTNLKGNVGAFTLRVERLKTRLIIDENAELKAQASGPRTFPTHRFTAVAGKYYVIDVTSEAFDPVICLNAPDIHDIAVDGGEGHSRIVFDAFENGIHEVVVGNSGRGAYNLAVHEAVGDRTVAPDPMTTRPQRLTVPVAPATRDVLTSKRVSAIAAVLLGQAAPPCGQAITAWPSLAAGGLVLYAEEALDAKDAQDRVQQQSFHKVFVVHLFAGWRYQIDLESSAFDTYLRLEDAARKQLAFNDDAAFGILNSRLHFAPEKTGEYRIIVTSYEPQRTGPIALLVMGTHGSPAAAVKPVVQVEGELKQATAAHRFQAKAGVRYTIDLKSTAFDTYLRLKDPAGKEISSDDDGGGLNSRIQFTAQQDDEYEIVVSAYGGNGRGAYQLTVHQALGKMP